MSSQWEKYALELEARINQIGRAPLPTDEAGSDLGHAIKLAETAVANGPTRLEVDEVVLTADDVRSVLLRVSQIKTILARGAS